MSFSGLITYGIFFLTLAGIYAILVLGLNIQWGYAGMLNIGIGAFFSIGAYASTLVTVAPNDAFVGGFNAPVIIGILIAMAISGVLAFLVGLITLPLRSDYLAIATIGIAEIVRLILKNEGWLTNGVRGIAAIPKPLDWLVSSPWMMLLIVLLVLTLVFWASDRAYRSPWGRVLRAIREDEPATSAAGKNVIGFRLQGFVLGSMIMGLAGALYAHFVGFISPEAFQPEFTTFIVWVMLIAGGSGNTRGAIVGAFVIWGIWSGTELITNLLPAAWLARASALRLLLIGVLLQIILLLRPEGLIPEQPPRPKRTQKGAKGSYRIND
ncbi:branched-chain amino acid ABC transporter permease [Oscillatoria sp. CS-180]|uniref:branched-chain amino acid ABC transporter permease n=1 Tax=Oscillatoria sp. CS-180 TaxID=3021720 RepID=UPI00232B99DA|nr:branched-chain amino acid ABC transporter permease [Oscillatoria sp. CS-180]MDB9525324.1 branched-chain amino acid ABC transporter permease [Oscillatoria sp. CS-180]